MGIKGLSKLLGQEAPDCIREQQMKSYFGRKIAIDASMTLYQFLIAVRQDGPNGQLTNEFGEVTSHLTGLFYRTINMMEQGIKPVYVFDGKPPQLKSGELKKRIEAKKKAQADMEAAKEAGNVEEIVKFERRNVRVTREQNAEAKKLLRLMGIPIVEAPSEAEAQCAELCKHDKVYATATEDMDALTFGTKRMVRHMMASKERQKKLKIHEYNLKDALDGLGMDMDEFVDMCILLGCDYTEKIAGVGPKKAFQYVKDYKSIDSILPEVAKVKTGKGDKQKQRFTVPESFLYKEARHLFKEPEVTPAKDITLSWEDPKREELIKFMCDEKGFNIDRMNKGIERLKACKKKGNQKRLESFFGAVSIIKNKKRKKPDTKSKKIKGGKVKKTRR